MAKKKEHPKVIWVVFSKKNGIECAFPTLSEAERCRDDVAPRGAWIQRYVSAATQPESEG